MPLITFFLQFFWFSLNERIAVMRRHKFKHHKPSKLGSLAKFIDRTVENKSISQFADLFCLFFRTFLFSSLNYLKKKGKRQNSFFLENLPYN